MERDECEIIAGAIEKLKIKLRNAIAKAKRPKLKSSSVYTTSKSRERGLALIINNDKWEDVSMTRHGSNADVEMFH
ncbi:hypothetical protein niasHT_012225 [Heterodera trifolii]|uniref:Uncharacterized protein n=1 Tax=Heterodera trifolii TaxID=157864 RepID=A0ABD2KYF9_9BILA